MSPLKVTTSAVSLDRNGNKSEFPGEADSDERGPNAPV
jgi:hypothetical protein